MNVFNGLAMVAALGASEMSWWEGRWVDRGVSCDSTVRDSRPLSLTWERMDLGEAECIVVGETANSARLILGTRCREHGDAQWRPRNFTLQPSRGGMAMVMSDGRATWRLNKCPGKRS
jgi:hypothetical protein